MVQGICEVKKATERSEGALMRGTREVANEVANEVYPPLDTLKSTTPESRTVKGG